MRNQKVYDMVIMSTFLTIILVLSLVPNIGYFTIPFFPLVGGTIIHIPVLVAAFYFDLKLGTAAGLIFGLSSWFVAMMRAASFIEILFKNPLVSVLPRVLFAFLAVLIFQSLSKVIKNKALSISISAVLATIIHTILVLSMIVLFGARGFSNYSGLLDFLKAVLVFNSIFETVLAGILVTPIVMALTVVFKPNRNNEIDQSLLDEINK